MHPSNEIIKINLSANNTRKKLMGNKHFELMRVEKQFTAPFSNMWNLKFKAQPTNVFFATINKMFGCPSQLPTTTERCFVV